MTIQSSHLRGIPFVLASSLAVATCAHAQLYVSATAAGDDVLLRLDEDGGLEDVTVRPRRAHDLDTDRDGRLLAIADLAVYRWDVTAGTEEQLGDVSYLLASLAPTLDGGVVVGDLNLGVKLIEPDGGVSWLIEDPLADGSDPLGDDNVRYQGIQVDPFGPDGAVAFALRRPLRCRAFPTVVLRIPLDDPASASEIPLPEDAHDQGLAGRKLIVPEYRCPDGDITMLVDIDSGLVERVVGADVTTQDVAIGRGGTAYRVVMPNRIERWDEAVSSWTPYRELPVDRIWSIAPIESLLDRVLDCPDDDHGAYVSCIARRTQQLVKTGNLTRAERQELLRAAARSDIGKR